MLSLEEIEYPEWDERSDSTDETHDSWKDFFPVKQKTAAKKPIAVLPHSSKYSKSNKTYQYKGALAGETSKRSANMDAVVQRIIYSNPFE